MKSQCEFPPNRVQFDIVFNLIAPTYYQGNRNVISDTMANTHHNRFPNMENTNLPNVQIKK